MTTEEEKEIVDKIVDEILTIIFNYYYEYKDKVIFGKQNTKVKLAELTLDRIQLYYYNSNSFHKLDIDVREDLFTKFIDNDNEEPSLWTTNEAQFLEMANTIKENPKYHAMIVATFKKSDIVDIIYPILTTEDIELEKQNIEKVFQLKGAPLNVKEYILSPIFKTGGQVKINQLHKKYVH